MRNYILLLGALSASVSATALERRFGTGYEFKEAPANTAQKASGLSLYGADATYLSADSSLLFGLPDTIGQAPAYGKPTALGAALQRQGQLAYDAARNLVYLSHDGLLYEVALPEGKRKKLDIPGMGPHRGEFDHGSSLAYRRWRFKEPGFTGFYNPALAADGNTLYFSAELPGGKGGLDIWKTERAANGTWSDPENVKAANSAANEDYPFVAGNATFYLSSDRPDTLRGWNVFRLPMAKLEDTLATATMLPAGVNSNSNDYNFVGNKNVVMVVSDRNGEARIFGPCEKPLPAEALANNAADTLAEQGEPPIEMPFKFYFKFDEDVFDKSYDKELAMLGDYLRQHPDVKIEINGHTDVRGGSQYNNILSQKRSQKVFNLLVAGGCKPEQLVIKAFGKRHLAVEHASTENAHLLNRRVEIDILK